MIPFRRLTLAPAPATPPRRPPTIPAEYTCSTCDVTGRDTHCWCCGQQMGQSA